jgi:hypothetical protein
MATHPFLIFPKAAAPEPRAKQTQAVAPRAGLPSPSRQKERLEQKFKDIVSGFDGLQATAIGFEPELVVVFETVADTVSDFAKAAANVEGLEWVAEHDLGDQPGDEDFTVPGDAAKGLPARLYAVMTSQQAIHKLLSLWGEWQADPTKEWNKKGLRGYGEFKNVFIHLKDIRRWGPRDRLHHTGVLSAWEENQRFLADHPRVNHPAARFEVELWCRTDPTARSRAYGHLEALVRGAGGKCIAQAAVPEIAYHGVLAELPATAVAASLAAIESQAYTDLLRCEDVMFFRPRAQSVFPLGEAAAEAGPTDRAPERPSATPVVAVFDGLPLANHALLKDAVIIDDPDGHESRYRPGFQQHGTAMCSLILHGDLSHAEPPLTRPVYVRPILVPATDYSGHYTHEKTPDDVLLIDLFHRAIRRLVEGDGGEPAVAPSVRVVNLSFGNSWQPFDAQFSPLARLVDWLAWKHRLLFLVSVGNQCQDITISTPAAEWKALTPYELRNQVILAMRDDQLGRRPFSPAESLNSVSVGAWHEDGCSHVPDQRVDLFPGGALPSPIGTVAAGFDRAVKPEVYFPGGRQLYRGPVAEDQTPTRFQMVPGNRPPGLKVAAPGVSPQELGRVFYSRGTSGATALATRTAALAYERLTEYRTQPGWQRLTDDYLAVVLKALLVHGACRGEEAGLIEAAIPPDDLKGKDGRKDWQKLQRLVHRFVGCGKVDPRKSQFATDERATVLAWDELAAEQSHVYALPLPPTLASKKLWRRLTVTLAWLSPVNPRHKNYRQAFLWAELGSRTSVEVESDGKTKKKTVVDERTSESVLLVEKAGLDEKTSQRGTVQHRVWEGEKAAVFAADERLHIRISCKAEAGKMTETIPYALAVSLEVAEGVIVPIYEEIRIGILVPVKPLAK